MRHFNLLLVGAFGLALGLVLVLALGTTSSPVHADGADSPVPLANGLVIADSVTPGIWTAPKPPGKRNHCNKPPYKGPTPCNKP